MFDLMPAQMDFQQAFPVGHRELLLRIRSEYQLQMTDEDLFLLRQQRLARQAAEAAKGQEQNKQSYQILISVEDYCDGN